MKIGIDLNVVGENYKGGVGRYSIAITRGLLAATRGTEHQIFIIENKKNSPYINSELCNFEYSEIIDPIFGSWIYQKVHGLLYKTHSPLLIFDFARTLLSIPLRLKMPKLDLLYCPTTYLNFKSRTRNVVSLHDTQELQNPENFTKNQRKYRRLNLAYTLDNAHLIQVSSLFIKNELLKIPAVNNADRIVVIPEGVDIAFFHANSKVLPENRILKIVIPANFHVHKNQNEIISALALLDSKWQVQAIFVGEGDCLEACELQARSLAKPNLDIRFVGKIEDDVLQQIYQESHLVISASSYESSSLPLIEGLSSGCVALASDIDAHKEMAEQYPILLFSHHSKESLAELLHGILKNYQTYFTETAMEKRIASVKKSDWVEIARLYLNSFQRAATA